MLDRIQKFFGERIAPVEEADDAQRLRVATCALLLEAAHADDEFSPEEREALGAMVARRFGLDDEATQELLQLAETARRRSDDLYHFARLINDAFPAPRKLAVLELAWRVVYSDGTLEDREDVIMHRLGKVLGVRHADLMALKLKVKRELDGRAGPPPSPAES